MMANNMLQHGSATTVLLFSCLLWTVNSALHSRRSEPSSIGLLQQEARYTPLKIGSFNIQVFGAKKISRQNVKETLVKILLRYDIVLVQEIRSTSDNAINSLLKALNKAASPQGVYSMALSKRLGRTFSKEQYAFIYRNDKAKVVDEYVYDDDANNSKDKFEREPFVVKFKAPNTYVGEFALAAIHTAPSDAPSEIDHLVDVYDDITKNLGIDDVIILGDFNGGCSYVTRSAWKNIRLATDRRFYWLFNDDDDTNVGHTDCAYDRMVAAGDKMIHSIVPGSQKVFNFKQAFGMTDQEAKIVSDHWVIEVMLKDLSYTEEKDFKSSLKLTIEDKRQVSKYAMYSLRSKTSQGNLPDFTVTTTYSKKRSIWEISLSKKVNSVNSAVTAVSDLNKEHPKLVTEAESVIAGRKITRFLNSLRSPCQAEKLNDSKYEYQLLPTGSCSRVFNVSEMRLVCNLPELSCKIEFLFE